MDRILIAYASKANLTHEAAKRIADVLTGQGFSVDVMAVNKVTDLALYRAIVVGSAIRVGSILPKALEFIQKNRAILEQKSFNMFIVCLTLKDDTEENRKTVRAYLEPVRAVVKPVNEAYFAGALNMGKLGLPERLIMKLMKAPEGDYRKWEQIEAWAEGLVKTWNM